MAPQDLTGQTAIVVGASSAMGRATVKKVAASGVSVTAAARRDHKPKGLQQV